MKLSVSHAATWLIAVMASLFEPSSSHAQCARWLTSAEQVPVGVNDSVFALAVLLNGDIVAGGGFTSAGGVTANRIAR
jgi:hypothetical protein